VTKNWLSFPRASEIGSAFFLLFLNSEFQPKIVCKPSNIDVVLIKGRRETVYRQQQRIRTSISSNNGGSPITPLTLVSILPSINQSGKKNEKKKPKKK
jgi:hypothetical protein